MEQYTRPVLRSERLILKPPSENDYAALRSVNPCAEFYLMVGNDPVKSIYSSDEKFEKSFVESMDRKNYWHIYKDEEVLGVVFLHGLDLRDRHARYAIGIYNNEYWNKGYGKEVTQLIIGYAFNQLNLHRVELRVLTYNKRAIACYKQCGFVEEGVLRENAFINNEWHDDMIMSVLCHEYQDK